MEDGEMAEVPNVPGGINFDDFDDTVAIPKTKEQAKKANEPKDEETEDEETEDEETEDEETEDEETEDEDPKKPKTEAPKIKGKKISATDLDGKKLDLNTGIGIPVKVDGSIEEVPLQSLINNYSGAQSYDKKFTELDQERQGFVSRLNTLEDYVNNVFETAAEIKESDNKPAKAYEVMRLIAGLTGQNALEFTKLLSDVFIDQGRQLADMDERDLENWQLKRELDLGKLDREVSTKIKEGAERKSQTRQQDQEAIDKYGIDGGEYRELRDYLLENGVKNPTAQDVVLMSRRIMTIGLVEEMLPGHADDNKLAFELADFALKNPEMKKEDLKTILKQAYGESEESDEVDETTSKALKRKIGKKPQPARKQVSEPKPKAKLNSYSDIWDN